MYFELNKEYITLAQLLKICDVISSGGESKLYLSQHGVLLNGEKENRRGKKIYKGDVVVCEDGTTINIV